MDTALRRGCIICGVARPSRHKATCGKHDKHEVAKAWYESRGKELAKARYANKGRTEYNRRYWGLDGKPSTYVCKGCGKVCPMRRYVRANGQAFCSKPCRLRYHRAIQNPARRARKRGVFTEQFERETIFERDAWRCGICGKAIKPDVEYPHPLYGTIDHIIPIALGGEHTSRNVQAAHLRCNIAKHANDGAQLRLAV